MSNVIQLISTEMHTILQLFTKQEALTINHASIKQKFK